MVTQRRQPTTAANLVTQRHQPTTAANRVEQQAKGNTDCGRHGALAYVGEPLAVLHAELAEGGGAVDRHLLQRCVGKSFGATWPALAGVVQAERFELATPAGRLTSVPPSNVKISACALDEQHRLFRTLLSSLCPTSQRRVFIRRHAFRHTTILVVFRRVFTSVARHLPQWQPSRTQTT
jgi:hypothetical protein